MHNTLKEVLDSIPFLIKTDLGEYACTAQNIPLFVKEVVKHSWIILGGDVLNLDQTPTCDNWYYNPIRNISVQENIRLSAECCLRYSDDYSKKYGNDYLYVLVISDTFVGVDFTKS